MHLHIFCLVLQEHQYMMYILTREWEKGWSLNQVLRWGRAWTSTSLFYLRFLIDKLLLLLRVGNENCCVSFFFSSQFTSCDLSIFFWNKAPCLFWFSIVGFLLIVSTWSHGYLKSHITYIYLNSYVVVAWLLICNWKQLTAPSIIPYHL